MLHIKEIKYIEEYVFWVSFDDGESGSVDFSAALDGPVFDELKSTTEIAKAYVDPELETIAWPNGADLAPEFVKKLLVEQTPSRRQG